MMRASFRMRYSMVRAIPLVATAALVVIGATACNRKGTAVSATTDSSLVASLERGPCRGRCPVYRVEVYGDGQVRFNGKQYVGSLGAQTGNTSASDVRRLVQAIAASEFAAVDSSFVMGSSGCGSYVADLPMSTLSAKVGARMKTVQHDPGCRNAPSFLRTLEAQVDSVARTARWIAGNGEAAK